MYNSIFKVLFEVEIFLREAIEVLIEVKAREHKLLLLRQITLFNFFLVGFFIGSN